MNTEDKLDTILDLLQEIRRDSKHPRDAAHELALEIFFVSQYDYRPKEDRVKAYNECSFVRTSVSHITQMILKFRDTYPSQQTRQ